MRPWRILVAALLAVLVSGCGEKAVQSPPLKRVKVYSTVASLSPGTTEIFAVKMTGIKLIGRTASCNYPITVKNVPVVLNGIKPNFEMIIESKVEAVAYDPDLFSDSDLQKLKEAGIDLVPIGGDTLKAFVMRLYEVGSQFVYETAMMDYIGEIERAEGAARGAQPEVSPKVAMIMPDERGGHMIAGTKSFIADIIRVCGGTPVGPDSNKYELASVETLVSLNPDLIACTPKYDWLVNDARLQSIAAIKKFKSGSGTIAQLNADVALRRGSRVGALITNLSNFIAGKMGK